MAISKATREAADKAKKEKADGFAAEIAFRLMVMRKARTSEELAQLFNAQKVPTASGEGKWTREKVDRVLDRIKAMENARREAPLSPEVKELWRRLNDPAQQRANHIESSEAEWRAYNADQRMGGRSVKRPSVPRYKELPSDEDAEKMHAMLEEWERSRTPEERRAANERHDSERNAKRATEVWWNKYEKHYTIKRPLTYEEWRIVDAEQELNRYGHLKKGGPAWTMLRSRVPKP